MGIKKIPANPRLFRTVQAAGLLWAPFLPLINSKA